MRALLDIYRYMKCFGALNGISYYFKLMSGKLDRLKIKGIKHAIFLRDGSSDIPTFKEIFFDKEYAIDFDIVPEVIVDAGANVGLAAIYFANRFPDSKIISIEPEQGNLKVLRKNVQDYKNVKILDKALSNVSDELIYVNDSGFGEWAYITEKVKKSDSFKNSIETVSISSIMKNEGIEVIDILKIDIEGFEKELFESNYEYWLPRTRYLVIEVHDNMKKGCSKSLFKMIAKYDFKFSHKGENMIFRNYDI